LEEINLNGAPVTAAILAAIAEKLDLWGRVLVTNAAMPSHAGLSAFNLGRIFQAGLEALKNG
jgi:hypothetical protein